MRGHGQLCEKILNLALEIISLLAGEDCVVVKRSGERVTCSRSSHGSDGPPGTQSPSPVPPPHSQKILELTHKMLSLLTGEVDYVKGDKDLMTETRPSFISQDGSMERTTRERSLTPVSSTDCVRESKWDSSQGEKYVTANKSPPRRMKRLRNTRQEVAQAERNERDVGINALAESRTRGDPCEKGLLPTRGISRGRPSVCVKEEPDTSDNGDLTDTPGEQPADYKTVLVKEESDSGGDGSCSEEQIEYKTVVITEELASWEDENLSDVKRVSCMEEELARQEDGELPDTSISSPAEHYDRKGSAICQRNPTDDDIYPPAGRPHARHTSQPRAGSASRVQNFTSVYSPTKHIQLQYIVMIDKQEKTKNLAVTRTNAGAMRCSECGQNFTDVTALTAHQQTHGGPNPLSCSECQKCGKHQAALKVKPFSCAHCGKGFSYKSDLVKHQRIHTGEKPFSCSECGKRFTDKSNLVSHQRLHTGVRPFSCSECGKCFSRSTHLERHQSIHSGEKLFPCPECEKAFTKKSNLAAHQRTHTGEKPFACTECGKCFVAMSSLIHHQRVHKRAKPLS